jgi:hypothetical protein
MEFAFPVSKDIDEKEYFSMMLEPLTKTLSFLYKDSKNIHATLQN